jgi:hypothetical protein
MSYRGYRFDKDYRDDLNYLHRGQLPDYENGPVKLESSNSCILRCLTVVCILVMGFWSTNFALFAYHIYLRELQVNHQEPTDAPHDKSPDMVAKTRWSVPLKKLTSNHLLDVLREDGTVNTSALAAKFPRWFRTRADGSRVMRTSEAVLDLVKALASVGE